MSTLGKNRSCVALPRNFRYGLKAEVRNMNSDGDSGPPSESNGRSVGFQLFVWKPTSEPQSDAEPNGPLNGHRSAAPVV